MKTTLALIAALLLGAPASGQQAEKKPATPPKATDPAVPAAEDQTITLTVKPPTTRSKTPTLKLEGTAQMMDNVILLFNLHKMEETYAAGRLEFNYLASGNAMAKVDSKRFAAEQSVETFGAYLINAVFVEEYQKNSILEATKGKYTGKQWSFRFAAWNDDHLKDLGDHLLEMDAFTNEALGVVAKWEKASVSQQAWLAEEKSLMSELGKFTLRLQRSSVKVTYPASLNQLFFNLRNIQGTSPYFIWKDGKFAGGKCYHAEDMELKTTRNEPFTYDNIKRYISEGPTLAGREFCLWLIKDIRRVGSLKPALAEALKKNAEHPGVAPYAERLKTALPADCEEIEKAIRQK